MILETFPVGILSCNCTILGDETTREAIVVDPGENVSEILTRLAAHKLTLKQIIITHAHIDHVGGAARLKRVTGAPVFLNQYDLSQLAMMEVQAGWLGVETPEVDPPDASAEDGLKIGLLQSPWRSSPHPRPHRRQHLPLLRPATTSLCRGHPLRGFDRTHRLAWRRRPKDHPLHTRTAADTARSREGHPRPRGTHDDCRREGQ